MRIILQIQYFYLMYMQENTKEKNKYHDTEEENLAFIQKFHCQCSEIALFKQSFLKHSCAEIFLPCSKND